jgi:hypothetical protein
VAQLGRHGDHQVTANDCPLPASTPANHPARYGHLKS